ncbi:MAG: hypothetical protein JW754_00530 [Candidatus Aenigmarchaeota archaeon]|nr:hypothetical protein [Candidatus Aenigmarchaeota archaeon]
MAMDFLSILGMLPQILAIMQIIVYVFLAWFFGSLAIKGMKKHFGFAIKVVLAFGIGFLCLLGGTVLPRLFGLFQDGFFRMIQLDILVGGIIMSVVFAIALYLMTRKSKGLNPVAENKKLKERVEILEGMLFKHRVRPIERSLAMGNAEKELKGYKAKKAIMEKTDWMVYLENGNRQAIATIGGYHGELKETHYNMSVIDHLISEPERIIGIAIIVAFVVFSLLNFQGLPTMADSFTDLVSSITGLPADQLDMFMGGSRSISGDCISASMIFTRYGMNIGNLPAYENDNVQSMLEQETGDMVLMMYQAEYEGRDYIVGITLPEDTDLLSVTQEDIIANANFCVATETKICDCLKTTSA